MALKNITCAVALAVTLSAAPVAAGTKGWGRASDIGAVALGLAAIGGPVAGNDGDGLLQAGGSIAVGSGIAFGMKELVHEQRPDRSGNDSFPSAHTAFSFSAAATMHRRYGWQVGLPATMVAAFVGLARVEAKKHHWYDVLAGAAIGEASGMLITHPFDDRVTLTPWADSHGAGFASTVRF